MNGILSDELPHDRQMAVVGLMALLKNNGVGGPFLIVASPEALDGWAGELNRLLQSAILIHRFNAAADSRDMLGLLCSGQGWLVGWPGIWAATGSTDSFSVIVNLRP